MLNSEVLRLTAAMSFRDVYAQNSSRSNGSLTEFIEKDNTYAIMSGVAEANPGFARILKNPWLISGNMCYSTPSQEVPEVTDLFLTLPFECVRRLTSKEKIGGLYLEHQYTGKSI